MGVGSRGGENRESEKRLVQSVQESNRKWREASTAAAKGSGFRSHLTLRLSAVPPQKMGFSNEFWRLPDADPRFLVIGVLRQPFCYDRLSPIGWGLPHLNQVLQTPFRGLGGVAVTNLGWPTVLAPTLVCEDVALIVE